MLKPVIPATFVFLIALLACSNSVPTPENAETSVPGIQTATPVGR